ncbi:hypothetical protein [Hymenobacter metallicola]|uniref:Uncharacterized protein n=1 Tax=Hymenobacter metallicola TaxID=2563114 RepID=A0A4Z0QJS1_9BACT|nr:hypothetical protein [Hymenobacter metallicola]TGE29766.1 hypothetical protein E5K02_09990 [Hymenobacter metallicola]
MSNEASFTVAKSTVECYKIRSVNGGFAWADITIDANSRGGRIQIASDYGDWQHYWGAAGSDFKAFLEGISHDYAASKFGAERWINVKATVKQYKQDLIEARREEALTQDEARQIYDEITELEHESNNSIVAAIQATTHLESFLYDTSGIPELSYEDNPHFRHFWEELWPVLLAEFKKESVTA